MKLTFKILRKVSFLLVFFLIFNFSLLTFNLRSSAHPQPLVVQEFVFRYRPQEIKLDYRLRIDPVVQAEVFKVVDKNQDNNLNEEELKTHWNEVVKPNLISRLNNRDLSFEILEVKQVNGIDLKSLDDYAEIKLKATNAIIGTANSAYMKYDYKFLPNDIYGDYYAYNDDIFETPGIERINLDSTNPNGQVEYSTDFRFTNTVITAKPSEASPTQIVSFNGNSDNSSSNFLKDLSKLSTNLVNQVKNFDFNNPFLFLMAFVLLFVAGALHALTPGHGKSMVAAFLIGKKKSKLIDVLILGIAITLSHTLAIYIIGFALLALKQTAYAQSIVIIIEKVSAWLFLGLGGILIFNGYRAYKHFKYHENEQNHKHREEDHHHGHSHEGENKKLKIRNRWDLFYAGISGGIVPCFDALSILFVFNAIGRVDLGIILVFIFSLGLAAAIILLGVSLLYGKDLLKLEEKIGPKAEFIMPMLSGSFIALFGVFYILTK